MYSYHSELYTDVITKNSERFGLNGKISARIASLLVCLVSWLATCLLKLTLSEIVCQNTWNFYFSGPLDQLKRKY